MDPEYLCKYKDSYPTIYQVLCEIKSKSDTDIYLCNSDLDKCTKFMDDYVLYDIVSGYFDTNELLTNKNINIDIFVGENEFLRKEYPHIKLENNLDSLLLFFVPYSKFLDPVEKIINSLEFTEFAISFLNFVDQQNAELKQKLKSLDYLKLESIYINLLEDMIYNEKSFVRNKDGFCIKMQEGKMLFLFEKG